MNRDVRHDEFRFDEWELKSNRNQLWSRSIGSTVRVVPIHTVLVAVVRTTVSNGREQKACGTWHFPGIENAVVLHQGRATSSFWLWRVNDSVVSQRAGKSLPGCRFVSLSQLLTSFIYEMTFCTLTQIPYTLSALSTIFYWFRFFGFQSAEINYSNSARKHIWILGYLTKTKKEWPHQKLRQLWYPHESAP